DPRNTIEARTIHGLLQKTLFTQTPELLGQVLQARARDAIGDSGVATFNARLTDTISDTFQLDRTVVARQLEDGHWFTFRPSMQPASSGAKASPGEKRPATDTLAQLIQIETEQIVGREVKSPEATRLVGGWGIMFLLFAVSGSSAAFFDEKNSGIFQRLLSLPVTRAELLWSRFVFGVVLGLGQLTVMFTAGSLTYDIEMVDRLAPLLAVATAAAAACSSFGMLIAALAPNAQAANALSTFVVMIMSATGGAWFPLGLMPEFMQQLGKFTIVYWSMEGFLQVLWAGARWTTLLPTVGILLTITAGVMAIAIWRLNRRKIFG
ncbi:MAG TPA: ABC transporter permease, partial [Candidatus Synoicihabitans sp.]|nr:ABC transporter permease [Candidatus Synoicihabitans sp.]